MSSGQSVCVKKAKEGVAATARRLVGMRDGRVVAPAAIGRFRVARAVADTDEEQGWNLSFVTKRLIRRDGRGELVVAVEEEHGGNGRFRFRGVDENVVDRARFR